MGKHSPSCAEPFSSQEVLNCIRVEKSSWVQASEQCMHFSLLLTVAITNFRFLSLKQLPCYDRPQTGIAGWGPSPLLPHLAFLRVFYHSNRNEIRTDTSVWFILLKTNCHSRSPDHRTGKPHSHAEAKACMCKSPGTPEWERRLSGLPRTTKPQARQITPGNRSLSRRTTQPSRTQIFNPWNKIKSKSW